MSKNIAIIFAGGSGARMGSGLPKQFLEIDGKPIIIYTLEIFEDHPKIDEIYVACKEEYIGKLHKLVRRFDLEKVKKIVSGGSTGQDSIFRALSAAAEENSQDSTVLIHDGVRPCILPETIDDNLACVEAHGNAVTCTALFETPVISDDGKHVDEMPQRSKFYTAQAPQCFYMKDVMKAHRRMREIDPSYTGIIDTCTLMRYFGYDIHIVPGPRGNIKVTTPEDLYLFRAMIQYKETANVFGFNSQEVTRNLRK